MSVRLNVICQLEIGEESKQRKIVYNNLEWITDRVMHQKIKQNFLSNYSTFHFQLKHDLREILMVEVS